MKGSESMRKSKVFVYGTLKKGYSNHGILEGSKFIGTKIIKGSLYELIAYPGLKAGSDNIQGEVYLVNAQTFSRLDYLEHNGKMYQRYLINGMWTYFFIGNIHESRRIKPTERGGIVIW